jgi:alkylhydroperoxidase/carboxymuconolactone decarboxylase family protein YurZ
LIVEAIQHTGFYAGWPNGAASLAVAEKVLTEMGL